LLLRERPDLERYDRLFCDDRYPPIIRDRTFILIDDELATGSTMQGAILALRQQAPARIVVESAICAGRVTAYRARDESSSPLAHDGRTC
jgi:putative phosphoribosyl transferase